MPIYDLSYRHWNGQRTPASMRWLPIATAGLMEHLKKRLFLFWLFICWIPALIAGVLIYLHTVVNIPEAPGAADASFFHTGYGLIKVFYLLTAVFVGAGLIANDRRTNALQIYLSKPIRTVDYLLGKGAVVAAAVGLVTLVPGLTLFLFRWGLDKEGGYLASHLMLPFSIVMASLLIMITISILALTVSCLTKSGRVRRKRSPGSRSARPRAGRGWSSPRRGAICSRSSTARAPPCCDCVGPPRRAGRPAPPARPRARRRKRPRPKNPSRRLQAPCRDGRLL